MNHDPVRDPQVEALLARIEHAEALVDVTGAALDATLLHSYVVAFDPPVAVAVSYSDPVDALAPEQCRRLAAWLDAHLEEVLAAHGDMLFAEVAAGVATTEQALDEAADARGFLTGARDFLATGPQLYRSQVRITRLGEPG